MTGIFDIMQNQGAIERLHALDIEPEDDGMLLIGREISVTGRNKCKINGRPVPLSALSSLGPYLIDIHGQHEHQSLFKTEKHLEFLDIYNKDELGELLDKVKVIYKRFSAIRKELRDLLSNEKERAKREELLKFQIEEIDSLQLSTGEDRALENERRVLGNAEKLFEFAIKAHESISEGYEGSPALLDSLGSIVKELESIVSIDERLAKKLDILEGIFYSLQELSHELRSYRDSLEFDSGRLNQIEERLHKISRLRVKYGDSVDAILRYREKIGQEYETITMNEEEIIRLTKEKEKAEAELIEAAQALSNNRQKAAKRLEEEVMRELADLNMAKTIFAVKFSIEESPDGLCYGDKRIKVGLDGMDIVEFMISPNPGEELRPLVKIASGGELSRIMLALKTILASADNVPTLVFDEIDTGIGGRTADAVAMKLAALSRAHQVICITHLPQIAAMANAHYLIEKEMVGERTRTSLKSIDGDLQVEELARMLGGRHVSETTRKQALEMIERARIYYNN